MRRALAIAAAVLATAPLAAAGPARAATVHVMVVGRSHVLRGPRAVRLRPRTVRVGSRRCAAGSATPLSALLGTGVRVRVRDYGACGRRARDAGSLFVTQVAAERNRGRNGWVYKVGRRAGTAAAADPAGPFGTGHGLRGGQRLLWFWCVASAGQSCQRTLEVTPAAATAAPGSALTVHVRGYDDAGHGVAVAGATVRLGSATATTDAAGAAVVMVPAQTGRSALTASHPGMVRTFPAEVTVR